MKLDEKLVRLRKEKGLTQLELAEAVKVSRQAVSKWEAGGAVPSTDNLKGLSDLFGVPVDFLLNDEDEKRKMLFHLLRGQRMIQKRPVRKKERCMQSGDLLL